MNYKELNDFELIYNIRESNEIANDLLFAKYYPMILEKAKDAYFKCSNIGFEISDFIQEGMLSLNQAIDTFDESNNSKFITYFSTILDRKIISMKKSGYSLKSLILNEAISLEKIYVEDKILSCKYYDTPEYQILNQEKIEILDNTVNQKLTDLEKQVFNLKISGLSNMEIAKVLDKDYKTIDNALQRIKPKIKSNIKES